MKPILEVRNLWKQYKIGGQKASYLSLREQLLQGFQRSKQETFWALQDINFDVYEGECIGIIGRNGAGKSTLLKILSQITPPTKGYIKARGRVASLLEVGTGFHPELSGRENVYLNGSILGLRQSEIKAKFDEIVDFSGVEQFLDTPLKHYSSGMRLRLAFSVAAHLEPEILLIDEVLAVGDAEFQKKCLGKMDEVSKSGRTVIFVSHNLGAVKQLCEKSLLLSDSKIQLSGYTLDIIKDYLSTSKNNNTKIENYIIKDNTTINKLVFYPKRIEINKNISFSLILSFNKLNHITDLALLLFNENNIRVGIIDMREQLQRIPTQQIQINGIVKSLPLIEGNYTVGLYIDSMLIKGNYLDLTNFTIFDNNSSKKYQKSVRGLIELQTEFI